MTDLWDAIRTCAPTKRVATRDYDRSNVSVDEDGYADVDEVIEELLRLYPGSLITQNFIAPGYEAMHQFQADNVEPRSLSSSSSSSLESEEEQQDEEHYDTMESEAKLAAIIMESQIKVYREIKDSQPQLALRILSSITDSQRTIEKYNKKTPEDNERAITVHDYAPEATEAESKQIGRIAVSLYRKYYDCDPPQVPRWYNGKPILANKYTRETARNTLDIAVKMVFPE